MGGDGGGREPGGPFGAGGVWGPGEEHDHQALPTALQQVVLLPCLG